MKTKNVIFGGTVLAVLAGAYVISSGAPDGTETVTMQEDGVTEEDGLIVDTKTVDWQAVLNRAVEKKTSLLTITKRDDVQRDRELTQAVFGVSASDTRVRVSYQVEYPIGYIMNADSFSVSGGDDGLILTLDRPQLVAKPSVTLQQAEVIDTGFLIDEQAALVKLQQDIQPTAEKQAAAILKEADVLPASEKALKEFLQPFLEAAADGGSVPTIKIVYR